MGREGALQEVGESNRWGLRKILINQSCQSKTWQSRVNVSMVPVTVSIQIWPWPARICYILQNRARLQRRITPAMDPRCFASPSQVSTDIAVKVFVEALLWRYRVMAARVVPDKDVSERNIASVHNASTFFSNPIRKFTLGHHAELPVHSR
jgi:hypothetical protein